MLACCIAKVDGPRICVWWLIWWLTDALRILPGGWFCITLLKDAAFCAHLGLLG